MLLSSRQSFTNLAAQGELNLMKEDINSLDYFDEALVKRIDFVVRSCDRFANKIHAIVNFSQQKEKLLQEINVSFSVELLKEISGEALSKILSNFSSQILELQARDAEITTYIEELKKINFEIKAEGLVADAMLGQRQKLVALVERFSEKINSFDPLQRNQEGEYPGSRFIKERNTDLGVLRANLKAFLSSNKAIINQREKDRRQLKEEVESLKRKVSPFSKLVPKLDSLEKYINELDICIEKETKNASNRLQVLKNTFNKSNLLSFLDGSSHSINRIKRYKTKLNQAGKTAQAKANAFSSIIEKFDFIQNCANTPHAVSAKEIVDKVQVLEDEIQNQRNTLAQYRGIAFFRPLMRCIGRGEVTSLEYVSQLEHAIEGFKSSITSAI